MGIISKVYLCTYNFVLTTGWCIILCTLLSYYGSVSSVSALWDKIYFNLCIFQYAALLEIIHAITGLVRSDPVITTLQVFSRVGLCMLLSLGPPDEVVSSVGFPMILLAWSITEIVRYSFYFGNLVGYVPYFLTYLRYTLFIVLYPIGVTGEILCYYTLLTYCKSHPEAWTYALPNKWNFTFNLYYYMIFVILTYIPFFPKLYLHMCSQRKKILVSADETKKGL